MTADARAASTNRLAWIAGGAAALGAVTAIAAARGLGPAALSPLQAFWLVCALAAGALAAAAWPTRWRLAGATAASIVVGSASQLVWINDGWFYQLALRAPDTTQLAVAPFIALEAAIAAVILMRATPWTRAAHILATFGPVRTAALFGLIAFTAMSWTLILNGIGPRNLAAQGLAFFALFCIHLAALAALAIAWPADAFDALRIRLSERVSLPGDIGAERQWDRRLPWACAAFTFVAAAALALLAFEAVPHVEDEIAYALQARLMAQGALFAPAPPQPVSDALSFYLFQNESGRWFPVTMPGWPAALALGLLLGPFWMINPLCAALSVLFTHGVVRKLADVGYANACAGLLALSPFALLSAGSLMPHALTLALVTGAWLALTRKELLFAILAGALMGWLFLVRPLEGVTIGGLTGFILLFLAFRDKHIWPRVFAYGAGCAAIGVLLFPFNMALTGEPLRTALSAYTEALWGPAANAFGFGPDRGPPDTWGGIDPRPGHSALEGIVNFQNTLRTMQFELFGWAAAPASMALVFAHGLWGRWSRLDALAALILAIVIVPLIFYWFNDSFYIGARYWFMALLPILWLSVRGAVDVMEKLNAALGANAAARFGAALCALTLICAPIFTAWRGITHIHEFRGYHDEYRAVAHDPDARGALVFVRARIEGDFGSALFFNDPLQLNRDRPLFLLSRGEEADAAAAASLPHSKVIVVGEGPVAP
ncbi:MAG: hypothetical protein GC189_03570 [Alphaproteobacteria bacterium]|nr:hypothetical protein [Alphaproteobacteria bacterium]